MTNNELIEKIMEEINPLGLLDDEIIKESVGIIREILTRHLQPIEDKVGELREEWEKEAKCMNQEHHGDILRKCIQDLSKLLPPK